MTPHLYVLLANLTLYIAFYVILNIYTVFDGGCQPYWIWGSRRPHTKTRIIFVCHVMISMEGENRFSWIVMLKFKKKDNFCSFSSSGTRDIVFFCFFKMADSCCPSSIAKFKLPPN